MRKVKLLIYAVVLACDIVLLIIGGLTKNMALLLAGILGIGILISAITKNGF